MIRLKHFSNADGGAAAIVYSKFGRKRAGKFEDFLLPHIAGATIRPRRSKVLYIPLQKGRRAKAVRQSVGATKNLAFIPLGDGRTLIVRKTRSRSTPIALLVRQVRIPRTLNLDVAVRRERGRLPQRLAQAIGK